MMHGFGMRRHAGCLAVAAALLTGSLGAHTDANAATQAKPTRPAPVNAVGQPVLNADGSPRNYSRVEWQAAQAARAAQVASSSPALRGAAAAGAGRTAAGPAGTLASWGWAAMGSSIGLSGLVASLNGTDLELYAGGSATTFGGNDYWYAMRWNASAQQFDTFFVSDQPGVGIKQILTVATATARARDSRRHIVVALADGTVRRYDLKTKALISSVAGPCSTRSGLQAITAADLDGNGIEELISVCGDQTLVVTPEFGTGWSLPGIGGTEVVVGQMDDDAGLEIATTSGRVIDVATRGVQWYWSAGFGNHLQVGDIDGDGRDELIAAEAWYWVWSYDVERQLPKWSLRTQLDIGAIRLADVDGDGVKDLLVGDNQWGYVTAYDALTTVSKGAVQNPDSGISQIAVLTLPGSSTPRLLWGAGGGSTGADHLYVVDWPSKAVIWKSVDLTGPFIGPVLGDLDGDGVPELVFASTRSNSGYDSGCIVVLDSRTLAVRAISPGVAGGTYGWTGIHDLKLRDLDGDGKLEILVGTDWLYDGVIEAYRFSASNQFSLMWTNTTRPSGAPFYAVEVADIDGDGRLEVLGGVGIAHSGAQGAYVYAYDAQTGVEKWHTLHLGGNISDLLVGDFNGNGLVDFAASVQGGNGYVFNGAGHGLDAIIPLNASSLTLVPGSPTPRLLFGLTTGAASLRQFDGGAQYPETLAVNLGGAFIDGITVAANGDWWVGSNGQLLRYANGVRNFQSADYGSGLGRTTVSLGVGRPVITAGRFAMVGFNAP